MHYKDINSKDNDHDQDSFKPSDIMNEHNSFEDDNSDDDEILKKYGFETNKH
jgi:hypothetical protein